MKTMKKMGFASIAGAALAVLAPTAAIADTSQPAATNTTGSLVHRVSHALATTQQYTVGETGTGYKWDTGEAPAAPKSAWADSRQQKSTGGSK
ncbi:MAG: hypothetical protein KDI09_03470, partial [Halioglobus sp.]|nr:hypothetical protein [Halioglobus sp.]